MKKKLQKLFLFFLPFASQTNWTKLCKRAFLLFLLGLLSFKFTTGSIVNFTKHKEPASNTALVETFLEDFEDETAGSKSFTSNGQQFDISSGNSNVFDIYDSGSGSLGWNGSGAFSVEVAGLTAGTAFGGKESFATSTAPEGTTLTAGDIAVIGWNFNTKEIRYATLTEISAGTIVKFTDYGWQNPGFTNDTGDGIITWTVGSNIAKGTILKIFYGGSGGTTTLTNVTTGANLNSNIGKVGYTVPLPMLANGDGIFIYQGDEGNPYFIFGFNNSGGTVGGDGWNTSITATTRDSYLPNGTGSQNGLTNGVNAVGMPGGANQKDVVEYTGPVTATDAATWLSRLTNVNNWTGDDASVTPTITTTTGSKINITAGATTTPPTVTTTVASDITATSATLGGNVTADGGSAVTEQGIVWSITANPTLADTKVPIGTGTGFF